MKSLKPGTIFGQNDPLLRVGVLRRQPHTPAQPNPSTAPPLMGGGGTFVKGMKTVFQDQILSKQMPDTNFVSIFCNNHMFELSCCEFIEPTGEQSIGFAIKIMNIFSAPLKISYFSHHLSKSRPHDMLCSDNMSTKVENYYKSSTRKYTHVYCLIWI